MIAACICYWCHSPSRAKMARPLKERPTLWSKQGGTEEPDTNDSVPLQEGQTEWSHMQTTILASMWSRGIRHWHKSSQWGRLKLWCRIYKNGVILSRDIASQNYDLQSCEKEWVHTSSKRTWNYGPIASGYILQLRFSLEAARWLIREKGLTIQKGLEYSQKRILVSSVITWESKAAWMPMGCWTEDRQFQYSSIKLDINLAVFLFYHRWRCT